MNKVLILTYYFPPLGLGGTQRVAKFVKYLPGCGWQPTVVTVKPIAYWAQDESLMSDVQGAHVIRTESLDPQRILARLGQTTLKTSAVEKKKSIGAIINYRLLPFLLVPDSKILWQPFVQKAVRRLLDREKFDALLTTAPPHSVHVIGRRIAKMYKLPWLADFRDGWAGSHVVHEPTPWHYRRNCALQKKMVISADAVVTVSPGIETLLKAAANESRKFFLITNGFDPDDFAKVFPAKNSVFTMCYSGTINKFADPEPFLDALVLLKKNDPERATNFCLQIVGLDTTGKLAEMIRTRHLENVVEVLGHKDHCESVKLVNRADALLLIASARESDTFIPGKTFEYIGAQKPIFVISNSCYTNELLRAYPLAKIEDSFDPNRIYISLKEFTNTKPNSIKINSDFIDQFNRQKQTEKLAEILNTISRK